MRKLQGEPWIPLWKARNSGEFPLQSWRREEYRDPRLLLVNERARCHQIAMIGRESTVGFPWCASTSTERFLPGIKSRRH